MAREKTIFFRGAKKNLHDFSSERHIIIQYNYDEGHQEFP